MKKTFVILLVLVLSMGLLTACGSSGPDLTEVKAKYNQAADIFNEATTLFNANGWNTDPEVLKAHNEFADAINSIKDMIEDPEQAKTIDPEAMSKDLDELITIIKEYKAEVSVKYPQ